ncbi:unnamed protein product [marine sediment metagenome]|uniref:Uncharacterized protein n=1 Tax=marine sediment metagenome TaxID=412755 RepID=X0SXJ3_9ZZZZ
MKGKLPENRKYVLRYLTAAREGLIRDLGPTEDDLTTAQIILIDRIVTKLGIIRCIEEHIRENSVMVGDNLAPALGKSYLGYINSIRIGLDKLGISTKKADEALDVQGYIKEFDEKEAKKKAKAERTKK